MTTAKRVVADDVLGRISRKMWELQRRLIEGTLDPDKALRSLQSIIEGQCHAFPFERVPVQLSEVIYTIRTVPGELPVLIQRSSLRVFTHNRNAIDRYIVCSRAPRRSKSVRVQLASFETDCTIGAAKIYLQQRGLELANAWDMVALSHVAGFMRIIGSMMPTLWCLGTMGTVQYPDGSGGKRFMYPVVSCYIDPVFPAHNGWYWDVSDGDIRAGQYVLVLAANS